MRKHSYLKNDCQSFDTLKIKDRKIRENCSFLIKVKFHEIELSSPLSKSFLCKYTASNLLLFTKCK